MSEVQTKKAQQTISLLTDFGTRDQYVGTLKGVIKSINPAADIIDICHGVASHDIRAAAFQLRVSYAFFPKGTVHCVVVDPGVGSSRSSIVIRKDGYFFVGPDNGVFTYLLDDPGKCQIRYIENNRFFLKRISTTFHGRDVFAPVSAYLCRKNIFRSVGPVCKEPVVFTKPRCERSETRIFGSIIYCDTFGNLITNIPVDWVSTDKDYRLKIKSHLITRFSTSYASGKKGQLMAIKGSSGFVEIACCQLSAKDFVKAGYGQTITVSIR